MRVITGETSLTTIWSLQPGTPHCPNVSTQCATYNRTVVYFLLNISRLTFYSHDIGAYQASHNQIQDQRVFLILNEIYCVFLIGIEKLKE